MIDDENRPVIHIPYSNFEKVIEAISIITIAVAAWIIFKYYKVLPEIIPKHFGLSGVPDGFGHRKSLIFFFIVTCVIYLGLTILSRFPNVYNYPILITKENAEFQYKNARIMLNTIKVEIIIFFTYIQWRSIKTVLNKANGLGSAFTIIFLLVIFGTLAFYIKRALKN